MRTNPTSRKAAPVTRPTLPGTQILSWSHDKKMAVWLKEDQDRHPYYLNLLLCLPTEGLTQEQRAGKVKVTFEWVEE